MDVHLKWDLIPMSVIKWDTDEFQLEQWRNYTSFDFCEGFARFATE